MPTIGVDYVQGPQSMICRRRSFAYSLLLTASCALAYSQAALPKEWLLTTDLYGNPLHQRLTIVSEGGNLKGALDGASFTGKLLGDHIHFVALDQQKNTTEVDASVKQDSLNGEMSVTMASSPDVHVNHSFSGRALEMR